MNKKGRQLRVIDGLTVYFAALLFAVLIGRLLLKPLGIFAVLLSEVLSLAAVFLFFRRTNLAIKAVFRFKIPKQKEAAGGALVFAGGILLAIPAILFSHLIAPGLAETSFHLYDLSPAPKALWIPLFLLLTAVFRTLLFDGCLAYQLKFLGNKAAFYFLLSALYAILYFDLYLLIPALIAEFCILLTAQLSENLTLPFIFHLFGGSAAYAIMQLTTDSQKLLGVGTGIVQVIGMSMIFLGVSSVCLLFGTQILRGRSYLKPFGKLLVIVIAIVFVAAGCGLASVT